MKRGDGGLSLTDAGPSQFSCRSRVFHPGLEQRYILKVEALVKAKGFRRRFEGMISKLRGNGRKSYITAFFKSAKEIVGAVGQPSALAGYGRSPEIL